MFTKKEKKDFKIVKLPKIYTVIFACSYLVFHLPIISYIYTNDYSRLDMIVLFLIALFMSLFMFISTLNWRISYNDTGFYYKTSLNHSLYYSYSDIKKVKRTKSGTIILKAGKKRLFIDQYAIGLDTFLKQIK